MHSATVTKIFSQFNNVCMRRQIFHIFFYLHAGDANQRPQGFINVLPIFTIWYDNSNLLRFENVIEITHYVLAYW